MMRARIFYYLCIAVLIIFIRIEKYFCEIILFIEKHNETLTFRFSDLRSALINEIEDPQYLMINDTEKFPCICGETFTINRSILIQGQYNGKKEKINTKLNCTFNIAQKGEITIRNMIIESEKKSGNDYNFLFLLFSKANLFLYQIDFLGAAKIKAMDSNSLSFINCTLIEFYNSYDNIQFLSIFYSSFGELTINIDGFLIENARSLNILNIFSGQNSESYGKVLISAKRVFVNSSTNISFLTAQTFSTLIIDKLSIANCSLKFLINVTFLMPKQSTFNLTRLEVFDTLLLGHEALISLVNNYYFFSYDCNYKNLKAFAQIYLMGNLYRASLLGIRLENSILQSNIIKAENVIDLAVAESSIINNDFKRSEIFKTITFVSLTLENFVLIRNYFLDNALSILRNEINDSTLIMFNFSIANCIFLGSSKIDLIKIEGSIKVALNKVELLFIENMMLGAFISINILFELVFKELNFRFNSGFNGANLITFSGSQMNASFSSFEGNKILNRQERGGVIIFNGNEFNSKSLDVLFNIGGKSTVFCFVKNHKDYKVIIEDCSFRSNTGNDSALSFLYLKWGLKLLIKNSSFFNNSLDERGIILISIMPIEREKFSFLFIDAMFISNSGFKGGVLYVDGYGMTLNFNNCIFLNNKGKIGGVFFINTESDNYLYITKCSFIKNRAFQSGVYHVQLGVVIDFECLYLGNTAYMSSTATIQSYSTVILQNSIIKNAFSNLSFNIVSYANSALQVINTTFENCSSKEISAAFAYFSMAKVFCFNCNFLGLDAKIGTVLFGSSTLKTAEMINCFIISSKASLNAIIFLKFSKVLCNSLKFLNNKESLFNIFQSTLFVYDLIILGSVAYPENLHLFKIESLGIALLEGLILNRILVNEGSGNNNKKFFISVSLNSYLTIKDALIAPLISSNTIRFINTYYSFFDVRNILFQAGISFLSSFESKCILESAKLSRDPIVGISAVTGIVMVNSSFDMTNSSLSNFSNGAILILNSKSSGNLLNNSHFKNCYTLRGGAINLINSHLILNKTTFENNKAFLEGGALYFNCEQYEKCTWKIFGNYFQNNSAVAGQSVFWTSHPPEMDEETHSRYMGDNAETNFISSAPLYLHSDELNDFSQFSNFVSGDILKSPLKFFIKDYYNFTLSHLEPLSARISFSEGFSIDELEKISNSSKDSILGITTITPDRGMFNFENLKFVGTPNKKNLAIIRTDIIKGMDKNLFNRSLAYLNQKTKSYSNSIAYSFNFLINFSDCRLGQIFNSYICFSCPEGTYSLTNGEFTCSACPSNAYCPGGSYINLRPGFWRSSNTSIQIYKCNLEMACVGGSDENICAKGFEGPLCDVCVQPRENFNVFYYRDLDKTCKICNSSEEKKSNIILSILALFSIIYISLIIKEKLSKAQNLSSDLLKIFTEYLQINGLLFSVGVEFPLKIDNFNFFSDITNLMDPISLMGTLECSSENILKLDYNIFFKKLIICAILAFCTAILIFVIVGVLTLFKRRNYLYFHKTIIISYLIVFHTYQPLLIKTMFGAVKCQEINGKDYLVKFLAEECWSKSHIKIVIYLVLPFLILITVIVPGIFLFKMYLIKKRQNKVEIFNFWSGSYKNEYYFWDFFLMAQKYFLISSLTFIKSRNLMLIFNNLIIFFGFFSNQWYEPYKSNLINELGKLRWLSGFSTVIFISLKSSENLPPFLSALSYIIFTVSNTIFLLKYLQSFLLMRKNLTIFLYKLFSFFPRKGYYICDTTGEYVYFYRDRQNIEFPAWMRVLYKIVNRKSLIKNSTYKQKNRVLTQNT